MYPDLFLIADAIDWQIEKGQRYVIRSMLSDKNEGHIPALLFISQFKIFGVFC